MGFTSIKRYGSPSQGEPQPDWTVHSNGFGLIEGSCKLFYNHTDRVPSGIPRKGTSHPYDSRLHCYDISTTIGKSGIAYVDAKYIGIESGNTTECEWSISGSTSDESIQFHPNFEKMCKAAKPPWTKGDEVTEVSKLTGVIVDDNGNFLKFAPAHPTVPAIEQFVSPTATCECTFYTKDIEIATFAFKGNLGGWTAKIPYSPSFLSASGSQNWMLSSTSVSPYGDIYKCSWTFILSTLGKVHNPYVYKSLAGGGYK